MTTFLVPHRVPTAKVKAPAAPRPTPPQEWTCVNCDVHNPGRRRRCQDCGTTRD